MTIAVCFSCGAMKFGALTSCEQCKALPRDEDDIIVSLLLTDRHLAIPALESLSQSIMRGESRPVVDEKAKEVHRPAVREAQRMLGMALAHPAVRTVDGSEGYKIPVQKGLWKKMKHYWLHGWH